MDTEPNKLYSNNPTVKDNMSRKIKVKMGYEKNTLWILNQIDLTVKNIINGGCFAEYTKNSMTEQHQEQFWLTLDQP